MGFDTYSKFIPLVEWGNLVGTVYVQWNSKNFQKDRSLLAYIKFTLLMTSFLLLIYTTVPHKTSMSEVIYTKRDVPHYIEHFMVSLILISFTICWFIEGPSLAGILEDIRCFDKLGFEESKVFNLSCAVFAITSSILSVTFATLIVYFFVYTEVRGALAMKFLLLFVLISPGFIFIALMLWMYNRLSLLNQKVKELSLQDNILEDLRLYKMCYDKIHKVFRDYLKFLPRELVYLMGYFEITGELLYFMPKINGKVEMPVHETILNVIMLLITPGSLTILVMFVGEIQDKFTSTGVLLHQIYLSRTQDTEQVLQLRLFSQKVLIVPLHVTVLGERMGPRNLMECMHSIYVFCSLIIAFDYMV